MKLKVIVLCGPDVHGDVPHRLAVSDGVAIGAFRLMLGIENVCPTLQPDQELICLTGTPSTSSVPPIVPVTRAKYWLRRGVQPSYPRMVMLIRLPAGTENSVVCTHWWVLGSWMK